MNMDAFTQTTNVAVTLLSGKYSYLDEIGVHRTSGWDKIVITEFCFIPWTFLLIFISLLGTS